MESIPIDNIIVFLYLISILFIGIYYRSKHSSFKNYANVEGKAKNNKLLLVATIFVSSIGGGATFGIMEKAFSGYAYYGYALILTIPIDILIAIYLVPRISKHYGAESVGDIMAKYYGEIGRFIGGVSSIIVSVGFLAAQISVSGYIFQYILKINHIEGVILSYSIILIYTTIGGLQSILFTNLLQFFAMIIATPVITITGIASIGSENFLNDLLTKDIIIDQSNLIPYTIAATLSFCVMNLYPTFIQRALINKNPSKVTNAIYIKCFIAGIFIICVILNGLIAHNLYPDQPSNLVLPFLIDQIIPPIIKGIVVMGLLASVMSTADSDLNVTSIALVKDIFNPIFKVKNQQRLLLIARIINLIIGSLAIFVALKFNNVIDLVVFITGFWGPIILVPLVAALFNIVVPVRIMILSALTGATIFLGWEHFSFEYFHLRGVFIGTMSSLLVFSLGLILSLMKRRKNHLS